MKTMKRQCKRCGIVKRTADTVCHVCGGKLKPFWAKPRKLTTPNPRSEG